MFVLSIAPEQHFCAHYPTKAGIKSSMTKRSVSNMRLEEARLNAGFKKMADAVRRFDWHPQTYASHENGQTRRIPDPVRLPTNLIRDNRALLSALSDIAASEPTEPDDPPKPKPHWLYAAIIVIALILPSPFFVDSLAAHFHPAASCASDLLQHPARGITVAD